jgi:hypothetical protein
MAGDNKGSVAPRPAARPQYDERVIKESTSHVVQQGAVGGGVGGVASAVALARSGKVGGPSGDAPAPPSTDK